MNKSENVIWHATAVGRDDRARAMSGSGCTVWMTGLSGSGKSTVGVAVEARLLKQGRAAYVLDGDNLRHGLNKDLGFSDSDRAENVRRVGHVARLLADAGLVSIVTLISPFETDRQEVRRLHEESGLPFVEVYVSTSLEECERRDPKGLYAKARAGELTGFTGIDSPYEPPETADLEIGPTMRLGEAVDAVLLRIDAISGLGIPGGA